MEETYKEQLISEYRTPKNNRKLIGATSTGEHNNHVCGDLIRIQLRMDAGTIQDAAWTGKGCLLCVAAASILTEHTKGKTAKEIEQITNDDMQDIIKAHIPTSREECILTPLKAMKNAIRK